MNVLLKINSQTYITKTYHKGKPLPLGTFVLKRNFSLVHFSDKPEPHRVDPNIILDRLSDVTYELLSQVGSTLHVQRNNLTPLYPKQPLLYPHLRNVMRFSDSTKYITRKPMKYANRDYSPFNSDESLSDYNSSQDNLTLPTPYMYNTDFPSEHNSFTKMIDNPPFKQTINTPQDNPLTDRSRHQSQNQSILPNPQLKEQQKLIIA